MFDPGLQRIPPSVAREILEHRQEELEAKAEQHRELQTARAARHGHRGIRAVLRGVRHAVSGRH
jgi:hypothetical protein